MPLDADLAKTIFPSETVKKIQNGDISARLFEPVLGSFYCILCDTIDSQGMIPLVQGKTTLERGQSIDYAHPQCYRIAKYELRK